MMFHRRSLPALAALLAHPAIAEDLVEPGMRLLPSAGGGRGVALTLDCCSGGFDARIAETMIALGIPATCFLSGSWIRQNTEALALLRAHPALFGFANHGARHVPPVYGQRQVFGLAAAGDAEAVVREVADGAIALAEATGTVSPWYRAATGFYSAGAITQIRGLGLRIAGYSLSADLGASLSAEATARRMAGARDGEVIVAHLNQPRRPSGAGVAAGLQALHAAGVRFVRLDQLPAAAVTYD